MSLRPETVHNYETAVHESFLRTLNYCAGVSQSLETPEFTQCVKAAGVNFAYAHQIFTIYKTNTQLLATKGMLE
jgi:hypothetical protein